MTISQALDIIPLPSFLFPWNLHVAGHHNDLMNQSPRIAFLNHRSADPKNIPVGPPVKLETRGL